MAQSLVDISSEISAQAKACLEKFRALNNSLQARQLPTSVRDDLSGIPLENPLAKFTAWGRNIAAFQDPEARISLDYRLKDAPAIRNRVLQILRELQEYLQDVGQILRGEKPNTSWISSVPSDSSSGSEDNHKDHKRVLKASKSEVLADSCMTSDLQELLRAISASVSSLMKISIVIRSSTSRDDYLKAASRYRTWDPYADIGHVIEKFGKSQRSEHWLLERLGKAVTRRRQFLKYRVEHHGKMTIWENDGGQERPDKTIVASTKATTFDGNPDVVQQMQTVSSDAGNSVGSQTSYDPTVFGRDGSPINLTVPPPPSSAFPGVPFEYGEPFQCPYCYTEQIVKNKSSWKNHVFRDLKPYVCTFQGCEMLMFRSRNEWFAHELENHRKEWICQFCDHDPLTSVAAYSKHVKSAHGEIVASSSLEALILQSEERVDKVPSSACLLCDDWEADLKQKQLNQFTDQPRSRDLNNVYETPKQFRKHLARHMEQLALFALPSSHEHAEVDGDGSEDDADDVSMESQKLQSALDPYSQDVANTRSHNDPVSENQLASELVQQSQSNSSGSEISQYKPKNPKYYQTYGPPLSGESWITKEEPPQASGMGPQERTYTRMSRKKVSLETLRYHAIEYELDKDPDYVLIRRDMVSDGKQDVLREHTQRLRKQRREQRDHTMVKTEQVAAPNSSQSNRSNRHVVHSRRVSASTKEISKDHELMKWRDSDADSTGDDEINYNKGKTESISQTKSRNDNDTSRAEPSSNRPSLSDDVLVHSMDDGKAIDIARRAGEEPIASNDEDDAAYANIQVASRRPTQRRREEERLSCPVTGCTTTFGRIHELVRHHSEFHAERKRCPVPECKWRGTKREHRIRDHIAKKHPDYLSEVEIPEDLSPNSSPQGARHREVDGDAVGEGSFGAGAEEPIASNNEDDAAYANIQVALNTKNSATPQNVHMDEIKDTRPRQLRRASSMAQETSQIRTLAQSIDNNNQDGQKANDSRYTSKAELSSPPQASGRGGPEIPKLYTSSTEQRSNLGNNRIPGQKKIYTWSCCTCGTHGGMSVEYYVRCPGINCQHARCYYCPIELFNP